ncbi:hypothetical protein B0H11DRAFT_471982 [Mycena galericulata]|nr:hypothetical protein B0H11DRAFT_471982 [Mycena galericulata]
MPEPRLFITALLGTPPGSPRHIHDNLWFLADFVMAHRLLAQQAPLDHQSWLSQIDIYSEVEKVKKTFPVLFHGPRHSERFVLPPPGEENPFYLDGPDLKEAFLRVVTRLAGRARKVDHLVFLIFGHGDPTAFEVGSFQCGAGFGGETVWLTKKELEAALKGTKAGRVSLVSTSCYAGDLASDHWALFFSAAQTKESFTLPTSASNRGWGSLLWAAIPELAANSYGHTFHPALQQPQIMLFKPIIQEDHLMPLTENSELPRSGSVIPPLQLGISDCGETINQTCATLFNTIPGATSHNFYPTFPDNAQWASLFAVLGVDSCLELVRRAHGLAHQPPNPSTHKPPPATGSFNPQSNNIDQDGTYDDDFSGQMENSDIRDDADADKEHRRSSLQPEEDETEVDTELLTGMLKRWLHDTGPLALDTAARRSLLRKAESFLQGTADLSLTRALFRQFCARGAADALAQQLAETLGIAHPESQCADFREVEDLPAYLGLQLYRMRWGRLAPRDENVIDYLSHPYRRAGQWVFLSWTHSGRDIAVIQDLLDAVGGCILPKGPWEN